MNNNTELKIEQRVAGFYKVEAVKVGKNGERGKKRLLADWFPNLITNLGLNKVATTNSWLNSCQVGSGSTTPAFTDTTLDTYVAGVGTPQISSGKETATPYYAWSRRVFTFPTGAAEGNLTEIGVGSTTATGNLFSRALIVDEFSSPTTITILSDEILIVTYECRFYPKLIDDIGTVIFTGSIGGTYDWIMRSANVGSTWDFGSIAPSMNEFSGWAIYNGDIGAVTAAPSGTSSTSFTPTAQSYVSDSYERAYLLSFTTAQGNLSGGIRSLRLRAGVGDYQWQFDPAIPKTASDTLTFTVKCSWGRV